MEIVARWRCWLDSIVTEIECVTLCFGGFEFGQIVFLSSGHNVLAASPTVMK
jgi:hypothetical protein